MDIIMVATVAIESIAPNAMRIGAIAAWIYFIFTLSLNVNVVDLSQNLTSPSPFSHTSHPSHSFYRWFIIILKSPIPVQLSSSTKYKKRKKENNSYEGLESHCSLMLFPLRHYVIDFSVILKHNNCDVMRLWTLPQMQYYSRIMRSGIFCFFSTHIPCMFKIVYSILVANSFTLRKEAES